MLRKAVVGLAPLLLGACSLLLGEGFTSPDQPSTGAGSSGDGAVGNGDDAAPKMDGSAGDATSDGGPDAGPDDCTIQGTFCDSFERNMLQSSWDTVHKSTDQSLKLVPGAGGAGSRLEASIADLGDDATLEKAFQKVPAKFYLAMTLEIVSAPTAGSCYIAGISMFPPGGGAPSLVYLYMEPVGSVWLVQQVTDGGMYTRDAIGVDPGKAHRVAIDFTFGGMAKVSVDGVEAVSRAAASFLTAQSPILYVGGSSIDGTGKGLVDRIDDVVFRIQ